jgi:hypothetical protein
VLELDLFRSPAFSLASAATFLFFAGFAAFLLGGVLFLTEVWHYSIVQAGFGFAPGPAMAAMGAALSGRLAERFGPAALGVPGGILFAASMVWYMQLGVHPDYVGQYLPSTLLGGTGVGLILPSFTAAAVLAIPSERLATGIGGETAFRQIGAALGIASFVALFGTPAAGELLDAFDRGFAFMAVCSLLAGLTMLVLAVALRRGRGPAAQPAVA